MNSNVYDEILEHFETKDGPLKIEKTYDLQQSQSKNTMDEDASQATRAVYDLSLNFDINAKHKAKRVNDEEEINTVNVAWSFWR